MKDRTITLTNNDGDEVICDILFTYYSEEFGKHYAVIKPRGYEECTAYSYDEEEGGTGELHPIETDEEWNLLEDLLEDYANNLEDEECSSCENCSKSGCCSGSCEDGE